MVILDEADRLLDMGFTRDIDVIKSYLNKRNSKVHGNRQTLLFSATLSKEIKEIAAALLLPGYQQIDTVGDEAEQTHTHVPQLVMEVPLGDQLATTIRLLEMHKALNPAGYKIMLFFPTARQTAYYAALLAGVGMPCLEIHSRRSQSQRTKASDEFRSGRNAVLLTSDVSARGLDYPGVTLVLQLGLTARDQYVHRLGRTARAGSSGVGMLLLAPFEYQHVAGRELRSLPLRSVPLRLLTDAAASPSPLSARAAAAVLRTADQPESPLREAAERAWAAWLGFYLPHSRALGMDKARLVQLSAEFAAAMGLSQLPSLPAQALRKMGLQGVAGLTAGPSVAAGEGAARQKSGDRKQQRRVYR